MFQLHVCLEITNMFCAVIALCASERLLAIMNLRVHFEAARHFACVIALHTTKRLLAIMFQEHVCLEIAILICTVITLCASKRLCSRVNSHVPFEVA